MHIKQWAIGDVAELQKRTDQDNVGRGHHRDADINVTSRTSVYHASNEISLMKAIHAYATRGSLLLDIHECVLT